MTAGVGTPAPADKQLVVDVLGFANRVHQYLEQAGRTDLAARMTAEAERWNDTDVTVIVAGEVKRGKSSLLNALVDRPGLLPVNADVATSVHLVVRSGDPAVLVTRLTDDGGVAQEQIDPERLVEYASMQGDEALRSSVTAVEVRLHDDLLDAGLSLVDTPGVGGMSRGHRDITMSALQRADVLMFTVSAQDPVSRTELEFLAEASERIDTVIFVVTKADLNADDRNEALMAEDHARLAAFHRQLADAANDGDERAREVAQRFARLVDAPFVLTSAYLAEQAAVRAERGRGDAAVKYRERSGVDRLREPLRKTVESRRYLRLANVVQLASVLVGDARRDGAERLRAAAGDTSVEDEMAAQQQQVEDFASKQARWRGRLNNGIQRMQATASRNVAHELNLVRDHYQQVFRDAKRPEELGESMPAELERSLMAAWTNLSDLAAKEFAGVVNAVFADFEIDGMESVLGDLDVPPSLRELVHRESGPDAPAFTFLEDGLPLATQMFSFANIANAGAAVLGLTTGGLGLVAYGVGAAISAPIVRARRKARKRAQTVAEFSRLLNDALFGAEGIAKEFGTELNLRILDVREQVEDLVDKRLAERRAELERRRRELVALMKTTAEQKAQTQARAQAAEADLAKLAGEADRLRDLVHRALDPA